VTQDERFSRLERPENRKEQSLKRRIKSLDVFSVAKMFAAVYGGISLVFIVPIVIIGFSTSLLPGMRDQLGPMGAVLGVVIALLLPAFYAAFGFVGGAAMAFVYNVAAKHLGGIEFNSEEVLPLQP
jgi:hypothetical protein